MSWVKTEVMIVYTNIRIYRLGSIRRYVDDKYIAGVYNMLNIVIGLSYLCCHNVLYFLNNPSVIFLTQLHSISEYCRILDTPHHLWLYWNWLNTLPPSSSCEGGELGGASLQFRLCLRYLSIFFWYVKRNRLEFKIYIWKIRVNMQCVATNRPEYIYA
jgi:hypothetical protein